jgi:hypothetical protein
MYWSLKRLTVISVLAVVSMIVLSTAVAHDLPQERTVLVQISENQIEVMLVFLEPPGPRAEIMLERFDLNRDGELRGAEAMLAGGEWTGRVLDGLQFEVAGETPTPRAPEIKFRREQRGALSAAVYARWDLEPLGADQTRTVHVRMLRQADNVPTEVTFQASAPLELSDIELPTRFRGSPVRPVLKAGEQASAQTRRASSPSAQAR